MTDLRRADARARADAIDPAISVIVQAPAGSGKTSLLTQRYLRLLAEVGRPEEIVAITFTRKAAAEMRHRIVAALRAATQDLPEGAGEHERLTRRLALAALQNGQRRGWELERHPSRLHIQTIDGLNHWLAGRLPLSARLGLSPRLLDDVRPLYEEAARRFTARAGSEDELGVTIEGLIRRLDHQPARLEALLADMLAQRELWLPKLLELFAAGDLRRGMERLLLAVVDTEAGRIRSAFDSPLGREIVAVLREAAQAGPDGPLAELAGVGGLPAGTAAARAQWDCVAAALLTKAGEPRRALNKNQGFPPTLRPLRERMEALLARLAGDPALCTAAAAIARLPPAAYTDDEWQRVAALCRSLVPAAAELQALFAERGVADHAAVAAAARDALGAEDAPTELALALEYRVRHILVDEYQDTSPVQQRLLERLVAGWAPADGHTLFCVGDPMQSIYGFREADVTLFLQAQAGGIGGVGLASRSLARNFRSCRAVIDWVNEAFARLMPAAADYERGAVPYTPSDWARDDEPGAGVTIHPLVGAEDDAAVVADIIERELDAMRRLDGPDAPPDEPRTLAVLVRSRAVLPPIIAELRRRGIDYRGVELEGLADRPAVRDLLALARALLHPGDRTAWLAVLRAPWCGLSLPDLHGLAAPDLSAPLLDAVQDPRLPGALSADGRRRLARVVPILATAMGDVGRQPLGSLVRACWLALGGPATLPDRSDLENADTCFTALDELAAEAGCVPSAAGIEAAVEGLMASPVGSEGARVQLMTIHKAKGLEFDTVVVPGMERTVAAAGRRLLYWAPVALEGGLRGIVLAGRGDAGEAPPVGDLEAWMRRLEGERERLELGRLAYVAATRARRRLHWVGSAAVSWRDPAAPALRAPAEASLLGFFWPVFAAAFANRFAQLREGQQLDGPAQGERPRRSAPPLLRLPADYRLPEPAAAARPLPPRPAAAAAPPIRPQFEWAGEEAMAVGTVLHAELEELGRRGLPPSRLAPRPALWRSLLERLGLPGFRQASAIARIERAVARVARSAIAAHLLDPGAEQAASELSLTAWLDGEFVSVKIDRSFVDGDGVRWIVDWKTGSHEGAGLDDFLASEAERYAAQLERYARVMRLHDPRPQRLGLYFPLLDAWREVRVGAGPGAGSERPFDGELPASE